jgi:hypothetical protein
MTRSTTSTISTVAILAAAAMTSSSCSAFVPSASKRPIAPTFVKATAPYFVDVQSETPFYAEVAEIDTTPRRQASAQLDIVKKSKPAAQKKKPVTTNHSQDGIFAPVVKAAKVVLGEEKLNKIRGKVIGMHSDVIGNFVDTYEWPTGQIALKTLFQVADKDGNGIIDEKELMAAFNALGFTWLKEKQIQGILKRADNDENGVIDMEEFMKEAPKTLRTNLVKLAKKNGGDLGFLA